MTKQCLQGSEHARKGHSIKERYSIIISVMVMGSNPGQFREEGVLVSHLRVPISDGEFSQSHPADVCENFCERLTGAFLRPRRSS
jgi:hypothetical protein